MVQADMKRGRRKYTSCVGDSALTGASSNPICCTPPVSSLQGTGLQGTGCSLPALQHPPGPLPLRLLSAQQRF